MSMDQRADLEGAGSQGPWRPTYDPHERGDGMLCPMSGAPFAGGDSPRCMCGQAFTVANGQDPGEYVPHTMHTHRRIDRRPLQPEPTCPAWDALTAKAVLTDVWGHTAVILSVEDSRDLQLGPTYAEAARLARLLTQGQNPGEALEVESWVMAQWRTHASSKAVAQERATEDARDRAHLERSTREQQDPRTSVDAPRPPENPPAGTLLDQVLGTLEVAYEVGGSFNCGEADKLALAMRSLGAREGAALFLAGHACQDDEGDSHGGWPETDPRSDECHPVWRYQPKAH